MTDAVPPPFFTTNLPSRLPAIARKVLGIHNRLQKFERFDPERQNIILSARLDSLLTHAKHYAPFWKDRLRSWTPGGQTPNQVLRSVPRLSRSELQSHHSEITADFPERKKFHVFGKSTSGSTGVPVRVEHLREILMPGQLASTLVEARWHNVDPMKPVGVILADVKDNDHRPLGTPFSWYGPVATGFSRCAEDREYSDQYDYCVKKNPSYLYGSAMFLAELASYAIKSGRRDWRPEVVFSFANVVTEKTREIVWEGLGAKIIDRYSAEETGIIARQCPKHNHLHVLSPLTLVEIVDDNGAPCSVGQPGRVLVTGMRSYGMPLIRYEIGDIAEWGDPCDCGIRLPVIGKLWGRTHQLITHPNGLTTFARVYAHDFEDLTDLQEYRFVLHQNAVIVAQLKVKNPSPDLAPSVTERAQRAVGYPYPVIIQYVEEIDWGTSWKKANFSVSDSPPPDPAPTGSQIG